MTTVEDPAAEAREQATTDDRPWRYRPSDLADRFLASDPGLNRLRMATITIVTMAVAMAVEFGFIHATRALLLSAPPGAPAAALAKIGAANHAFTVIALLLGAIMGMMSGFGIADPTVKGQAITMAIMPFPVIGFMFAGLALAHHRLAALALIVVGLGLGIWCRRFGPRGFIGGMLMFMGSFLGYFIGADVPFGDSGWLVCFLLVGLAVSAILRFTIFRPRPKVVLQRTLGSFRGRGTQVALRSIDVLDRKPSLERDARRLRRRLVRLNEAALMVDAQLTDVAALPVGADATRFHEVLFDLELGIQNLGRRVEILARLDPPSSITDPIRRSLVALANRNFDASELNARVALDVLRSEQGLPDEAAAFAHRIAMTIVSLVDDIRTFEDDVRVVQEARDCDVPFQSSVMLMMGNLAGSALVSNEVAGGNPASHRNRWWLAPSTKTAIQVSVATALAITAGDALSGRRYYWAVIAVMVTAMGTNTAGEKVTKAFNRVVGTLIGIVVGSWVVDAVGTNSYWSLAAILIAMFLGLYLMRISYMFFVIGITTMVSQLYVQLDEFSHSLLVLRLEETSIGAAIGLICALLIFPVSTRKAAVTAMNNYLTTLADLVARAGRALVGSEGRPADDGGGDVPALRAQARNLDNHLQQLLTTVRPLQNNPFGRNRLRSNINRFDATAHQARNLAVEAEALGPVRASVRDDVLSASLRIQEAVVAMGRYIAGDHSAVYHRSSALLDRTDRFLEAEGLPLMRGDRLALHHLKRIERMMADLAREAGMETVDDSEPGPRRPEPATAEEAALAVAEHGGALGRSYSEPTPDAAPGAEPATDAASDAGTAPAVAPVEPVSPTTEEPGPDAPVPVEVVTTAPAPAPMAVVEPEPTPARRAPGHPDRRTWELSASLSFRYKRPRRR